MTSFPLPFKCEHLAYVPGAENSHGNPEGDWAEPVERDCFWWDPSSLEMPTPPTGGTRVVADRYLVVDSSGPVDHRDKFKVNGHEFTVIGLPQDYNHGPFGFSPDRLVIELKWVG
ncbi:hypothetical protein [Mycobacteroides abscessus]|uniref:hypothetical protein n=1 Tax=Mycobacteroides abscessus TaxID=36809 RepID=UPI0009A6B877|nr:hypothetical protein [Mycobacteroides abscessus]SKF90789.1 Uncharacterised protein [Mycobacteroides abscessus subsp. bolletii]SKG25836.1 Uncharacterised protein [Mycobacteroides abscessus subsp. bolletii]SKH28129.1 Uncharacterised protein [Mycobacteroides abscessus subsp. bolletii]SKH59034.1 Uncharacterised protein [Mycobacteroides abscessus subsp. bolletii]SKH90202.1 Uncharacterised protein [Mycobacteroides abscessus subsp. bolletii]